MGENELKFNISLKVKDRGKLAFYSLISAGENWYDAKGECELLLSGTPEIDFWIQAGRQQGSTNRYLRADGPS